MGVLDRPAAPPIGLGDNHEGYRDNRHDRNGDSAIAVRLRYTSAAARGCGCCTDQGRRSLPPINLFEQSSLSGANATV